MGKKKIKNQIEDNMIEMVDLSENKPAETDWVELEKPTETEQKEIDELNQSAAMPIENKTEPKKDDKPKEKNAFNYFMTNLCTFLIDTKLNNNKYSGFITFAISLVPALIYSGWKSFKRERPKVSDVVNTAVDMLKEQDPEYVGKDEDKFKSLGKDKNGLDIENEKDLVNNILDLKDEKNKDAFKTLEEDGAFLQFFKELFGVEYKDMYGEKEQEKKKDVLGNSVMDRFVKAYLKNKEQKLEKNNQKEEVKNLDNNENNLSNSERDSVVLPRESQLNTELNGLDNNSFVDNSRQQELQNLGITTEPVEFNDNEFSIFNQVATNEEVQDSLNLDNTIQRENSLEIQ